MNRKIKRYKLPADIKMMIVLDFCDFDVLTQPNQTIYCKLKN